MQLARDAIPKKEWVCLVSVAMLAILVIPLPTIARSEKSTRGIIQMVGNGCPVNMSPTSCQGGYTPNQTFGSPLRVGDIVTLTMSYLGSNSDSASLSFSDSLGNNVVVASSQCSPTSPIICTAVGYFLVIIPGPTNIMFTVVGGSSGYVQYTAAEWDSDLGRDLGVAVANGFCSPCTNVVGVGPIVTGLHSKAIAVGVFDAFYSSAPSNWMPASSVYFYTNNANSGGGYGFLWQATAVRQSDYFFSATTTPSPMVFAGSAEVLYS